ncbi:hypothetical protein ACFWF7_02100 [Nocardia sp. NPDC060256]|uniref:hypothetical protein n=1 Tax=unclassified Nocardia TaxID=2637762 RepID=UPI003655E1FF
MTDASFLRKRCEEIARALPIPHPFNSKAFIDALIEYRGRRIELVGMTVDRDTPCGMFVATPDADYIFYASNTSLLHQEHIIAHEAAHILCNHSGTGALGESVAPLLMKNLSSKLITRVLGRTVYSESDEAEAEMLASVILIRAGRAHPPPLASRELECGMNRFGAIFG